MFLDWNARTLQWYVDAEEYTGFFRALAAEIAPALAGVQTLCDLGCGPALFDFEIAPLVKSIEWADTSEAALAFMAARAQTLGLRNMIPVLADCERLLGRWDVIFMSFFGSRCIDRYLPLCRKLIAVVSQSSDAALFPEETGATSATRRKTPQSIWIHGELLTSLSGSGRNSGSLFPLWRMPGTI